MKRCPHLRGENSKRSRASPRDRRDLIFIFWVNGRFTVCCEMILLWSIYSLLWSFYSLLWSCNNLQWSFYSLLWSFYSLLWSIYSLMWSFYSLLWSFYKEAICCETITNLYFGISISIASKWAIRKTLTTHIRC